MIIDKNSDSSIDLEDWLRRSSDESELLARTDMLHSARIKDVYLGQTLDKFIVKVEYDEKSDTLTFIYNTEEKLVVPLDGPHEGGSNVDLSEYAKLTDLETEVSELESKIPTSTSSLINDSNFVNQTQVDDRIKEVIGTAPEALDTLQELSKALGDDPNFVGTVTDMITANTKLVEEVRSEIPSIEGLAKETWVTEQIQAIEIPSIEGLARIEDVNSAKTDIEKWVEEQGYLTEHQDISGLATKEEIKDAVNYNHFTYNGEERKTIQLDNHDTISGIDTKGSGHNLVMLSKWDVADFGAAGVHMNLNSSDKVTINDSDHVATEEWVNKQGFLTEHIDTADFATKAEVKAVEDKIPSIEGLATEKYVDDAVAAIEHPTVDLTGYATETWVEQKIAEAELNDVDPTTVVTKTELAEKTANMVEYQKFTYNDQIRKTIQLDNYDSVSGISTTGEGHNLVMLSKWDVADFGATGVHMNLNTKDNVTINDNEIIATQSYVDEKVGEIEHPQVDLTPYAKSEDVEKSISESAEETKTWVSEQGYLTEHQDISDVVRYRDFTYEGEERKTIDLDNYDTISGRDTKGDSHSLVMLSKWDVADFSSPKVHTNVNTLTTTEVATDSEGNNPYVGGLTIYDNEGNVSEHVPVVTVNDKFALATINHMMAIREADAKSNADTYQPKGDYATEEWVKSQGYLTEATEFVTQLVTTDQLNSKLAVLNTNFQWKDNVVTFDDIAKIYPDPEEGFSVYVDDEQTTYVYMGGEWIAVETAADTPVATEEMDGLMPASAMKKLNSLENYDDAAIQGDMTTLEAKLAILEERMSSMSKTNVQTVAASGSVLTLADSTKDYSIQGEVSANLNVAGSKSVTVSDTTVSNDARVTLKSTGDVELKAITTTGDFAKSTGNAIINIPDASSVTIKDMVVESTQYNGIEIGMGSTLPKSVMIDNCDFSGEFSNNAISIHGTQDNAVINISNCKFSSVSNPLRLSNKTGAKVTINITNCSCDKWETENEAYAGFLLCQDFTSTTVDGAASANLFGSDKVTINFINFTMPGGVRLTKPEDISTLCGSGKDQLVYVYRNADYKSDNSYVSTPYGDGSAYPMINII